MNHAPQAYSCFLEMAFTLFQHAQDLSQPSTSGQWSMLTDREERREKAGHGGDVFTLEDINSRGMLHGEAPTEATLRAKPSSQTFLLKLLR